MAAEHHAPVLLPVLIALLVGWRLYARTRRLIGRQRLRPGRSKAVLVFFPLLVALLMTTALARPASAAALALGVVAGAALGQWGLKLTRFEQAPEGLFYTPNAHLGLALSLLLVLRVVWRLLVPMGTGMAAAGDPGMAFVRSPLTLAIVGTMAGYYVSYAIGLLKWRAANAPALIRP